MNVLRLSSVQKVFFVKDDPILSKQVCLNHVIGNAQGNYWILLWVQFIDVDDSQQDQLTLESHFDLQSSLL